MKPDRQKCNFVGGRSRHVQEGRNRGAAVDPSEFETAVGEVSRPDQLWQLMVAYARDCGVERIGYHHLPPPGAPDSTMPVSYTHLTLPTN